MYLRSCVGIPLAVICLTSACAADGGSATKSSVQDARMRWNAALLKRDSTALGALLDDSAVHVSPRFTHIGKTDYLSVFLQNMARPEFELVYQPDRIVPCARPACLLATEYGSWKETWLQDGDPTEVSGTYYALWRKHGDEWQIRSEVFATLKCRGERYCRL